MKQIVGLILSIICSISMASTPPKEGKKIGITITKELVREYKGKSFNGFIKNKKNEYHALTTVTGIPFIGNLATWGLQKFGGVNPEEAKIYLGRIFEAEKELPHIIANLEEDEDNIRYLQDAFAHIPEEILRTKSRDEIVTAMRKARHKRVPVPKRMGEKNEQNEYSIPNKDFLPFALCNFWIFHYFEKQPTPKRKWFRY